MVQKISNKQIGEKMNVQKNRNLKPPDPENIPCKIKVSKVAVPLRSGLWHLLTRRTLSLEKSLRGSMTESMASIFSYQKIILGWDGLYLWEGEESVLSSDAFTPRWSNKETKSWFLFFLIWRDNPLKMVRLELFLLFYLLLLA